MHHTLDSRKSHHPAHPFPDPGILEQQSLVELHAVVINGIMAPKRREGTQITLCYCAEDEILALQQSIEPVQGCEVGRKSRLVDVLIRGEARLVGPVVDIRVQPGVGVLDFLLQRCWVQLEGALCIRQHHGLKHAHDLRTFIVYHLPGHLVVQDGYGLLFQPRLRVDVNDVLLSTHGVSRTFWEGDMATVLPRGAFRSKAPEVFTSLVSAGGAPRKAHIHGDRILETQDRPNQRNPVAPGTVEGNVEVVSARFCRKLFATDE
mmetsp:Transcript_10397/g.25051  ORF Transcript_10397/g.25051 Transcript_10397/m.25051 type:complete len:262 (-) Transcript_10397:167-952(-)